MLLTPRWLGLIAITIVASVIMIFLGRWQWGRYELRTAINDRIDASATSAPVPLAGDTPEWTRVSVSGQYDAGQEILIRNRTLDGQVGFEILTPLVQSSGEAVLVDRGWVPPSPAGLTAPPSFSEAPTGLTTIIGRVRTAERGGNVQVRNGHLEARRVDVASLATKLPYPIAKMYVLADDQSTDLTPIPSERENNWLNLSYAVQWWLFSAGVWVGLYYLARREQRQLSEGNVTQQESLSETHSRELA